MPQDFPPNYLPPDTYRPVDVPAVPNAPGTFVPRDYPAQGTSVYGGFGGGNGGGGGFFGSVLGFTRDVAAVGLAGRVLGNTLGVASEFTGARIPLGGGYNGLERRQVAFENTGYDAGIAYNRALTTSYNNYGQNGYGYNGGYGNNFAPQGFNGGYGNNFAPQGFNGGGYVSGYGSQGFNGGGYRNDYPPQGGNRYAADYGAASQNGGVHTPTGEFIDRVYNAHIHGSTEEMQAAINFAQQAGIVQRDGAIHFPEASHYLPNGEQVTYHGEVLPPAQAAQRLDRLFTEMGIPAGTQQQTTTQTQQTGTQTQQTQTQTQTQPTTQGSGQTQSTVATTDAPADSVGVPPTTGGKAPSYGLKAQGKPTENEKPANLTKDQVLWLQSKLVDAGYGSTLKTKAHPDGKDGWYGPKTRDAAMDVAQKAGINLHDVDLGNPKDPETVKFLTELNKEIAAKQGKAAAVVPAGPTPEQKAEAERKAAEQKAAAEARAREDAAQGPLLNTAFDARKLPQSYEGRYAMAREVLLDSRELHNERRLQSNENLHDKMKEAVRDANKLMEKQGFSKRFQSPAEDQPFTDDAMQALGIVTLDKASKGKTVLRSSYDTSVTPVDPLQRAAQAAASLGVRPINGVNPREASGDPQASTVSAQGLVTGNNTRVQ
ncbi:MAG: hypothetical protein ACKVOE_10770 [Rickettsiales bacterium]